MTLILSAGPHRALLASTLAVALGCCWPGVRADTVSDLPPRWQSELLPVADADISGAEPLMQQAIADARAELGKLLAASGSETGPDRAALAAAYGRLGALMLLVEVETQADAALRNAMELQPDELRWPYYAGYLAMLAGNLEQAQRYLDRARAIDPSYATLYVRLGKVLMDDSKPEAARAALEQVQDVPELVSPANYYLGQIALLERRYDDAVALLERALAANPDATEVHYPLAQAYRALGDSERARAHLGRFKLRAPVVHDPLLDELQSAARRSVPAFERAIYAVRGGDYATAVDELAAGLAVAPNNAAARISYARVLYLTGRTDDAAAQLHRALRDAPDEPLGHLMLGALRQQQGDLAAAESAYQRALALDATLAGPLFQLANLRFAAGDYTAAARDYQQVLALDPSVAPARLLSLVADYRAGVTEQAVFDRLKAQIDAYPEDPQLRFGLARLLAAAADPALRDPKRAVTMAADLAVQQPGPSTQRLLALAQAADGRFDDAAQTQRGLIQTLEWMQSAMQAGAGPAPAPDLEALRQELAAFEDDRLPDSVWPGDDPLLAPPPFDAARLFRDYPATRPY